MLFVGNSKSRRIEEKLTKQILEEAEQEREELSKQDIPATVIMYTETDDETNGVHINVISDSFDAPIMPEPDSIIWCSVEGSLYPYKCIRYDYICNDSDIDSVKVYIVVEKATQADIIPNPKYMEDI